MLAAAIPSKFPIPFAYGAGGGYTRPIPTDSQIGIQAGAASLTDGFPPDTFLPIGAGGTPPWGADFNGLLNQSTAWNRWQAAGGPVAYDGTFSGQIGGYPAGALVASATTLGQFWFSTVDNNTSDPDAFGAGWLPVNFGSGTLTTGDVKWRPTSETLSGFVRANALTIGNGSSNGTQLADAGAYPIFKWFWESFSNTLCPIFTSAGAASTRGANAAADFAANKAIAAYDMRGYAPIGMDTMAGGSTTRLTGVPAVTGNATTAGSVLGAALVALITAELAAHNHGITDTGHIHGLLDPGHSHGTGAGGAFVLTGGLGIAYSGGSVGNISAATTVNTTSITVQSHVTGITINNAGSGTAHNNTQLSVTGTWYFKT